MSATFELDKIKLRQSFGSASLTYDHVAELQRIIGRILLERTELANSLGTVLDLGCGTGFITQALRNNKAMNHIVALDIALPMLQEARVKLGTPSRLHYLCGDAESLPLGRYTVDTIVSNLALQWCRDLTAVFCGLHGILKTGGVFLFSTFGPQTLIELKQAWSEVDHYRHVNEFYPESEIRRSLMYAGFKDVTVHSQIYRPVYHSVLELMRELKLLGAHNVSSGRKRLLTTKQQLTRMIEAYPLNEGKIIATFEVFIVSARADHDG